VAWTGQFKDDHKSGKWVYVLPGGGVDHTELWKEGERLD
jgi:hypothetical protein